jgi:Flp pilus assembly protein TadG
MNSAIVTKPFHHDRRAVAAVEFAICAPLIAIILAAAVDYGFREWSRSCLANAVAEGAYYAFRSGTGVSLTNLQTIITKASPLNGVTVSPLNAPFCSCPSGAATPATLPANPTSCSTPCSDGSTPGSYLQISASYTLTALFPGISRLGGTSITEKVTVRLQ